MLTGLSAGRTAASIALALAVEAAFAAPSWAQCDRTGPSAPSPARYEIWGSEVSDPQTGLVWQRCSVGQHWMDGVGCEGSPANATWSDAMRMANGVWRVPSKDELLSLISATCQGPRADAEVFPITTVAMYWTSTEMSSSYAWYVSLSDGSAFAYDRNKAFAVRLVRGGKASASGVSSRR